MVDVAPQAQTTVVDLFVFCSWPFFVGFGVVGYLMAKISIPTGEQASCWRVFCGVSMFPVHLAIK